MSFRSLCRAKARRALVDDPPAPELEGESLDEDLGWKSLISQGVAAAAISLLGFAVAGGVVLTASAQSTEVGAASATGAGSPDQSRAVPAPMVPRSAQQEAPDAKLDQRNAGDGGALDIFARQGQAASRNAVRAEIDRAVADQKARERSASLSVTGDKAAEASNLAARDARATQLLDQTEARKREQARLAEEKRKAEEALKRGQQQPGQLQQPAVAAALTANQPPPQISSDPGGGVSGRGATPVPPGRYSLGARWGAVGSWSRYHTGQDLPAPVGTPIRAAADGVVVASNGGGWAGTHAVIRHGDGSATLYAHMSTMTVHQGQLIKAGDVVGAVGMTGRTFGPHLHFEHYPNAATVGNPYSTDDPFAWMLRLGVRL